jgi:hypothetical protein
MTFAMVWNKGNFSQHKLREMKPFIKACCHMRLLRLKLYFITTMVGTNWQNYCQYRINSNFWIAKTSLACSLIFDFKLYKFHPKNDHLLTMITIFRSYGCSLYLGLSLLWNMCGNMTFKYKCSTSTIPFNLFCIWRKC